MKSTIKPWKRTSEKEVIKNRVFSVNEFRAEHHEKSGTFVCIHCPDWTNVIAQTEEGEIIVVYQYRHGQDRITCEIPGGVIDQGEEPLHAAKRELKEETGYESNEWEYLGKTAVNPAIMSNSTHLFYAKNCKKTSHQELDEHEDIEVTLISELEFLDKVISEEIDHSLILAGISKWLLKTKR